MTWRSANRFNPEHQDLLVIRKRIASSTGLHSIRFCVLVRKHPRKHWRNLPDITFPSQSLDSFYSTISSQVGISGCPSIDITLTTADEEYIVSLPRNNENHFEEMKAFVMQKCRSSQPAQRDEPMALNMYMVRRGHRLAHGVGIHTLMACCFVGHCLRSIRARFCKCFQCLCG